MLWICVLISALFVPVQCVSIDQIIVKAGNKPGSQSFGTFSQSYNGDVLVEGDMIYSAEEWEEIQNEKRMMGFSKRKGWAEPKRRWTNKVLPYELWNGFSSSDLVQINAGIADWNKYTCVKLQERSGQAKYVYIGDGDGCMSKVGMQFWKEESQPLHLAQGCRYKSVVLHELGHAIGFHHEQCRSDRDEYLTILLDNVEESHRFNFKKNQKLDDQGVAYDYTSIMQYGEKAFSTGGLKTIITKDPYYQSKIGTGTNLAFSDVKIVNLMYNCGENCGDTSCPDGGYMDEYCECQCQNTDGEPYDTEYVPITPCAGSGASRWSIVREGTWRTCDDTSAPSYGKYGKESGLSSLYECKVACEKDALCRFIFYQPTRPMCHLYTQCIVTVREYAGAGIVMELKKL